MTPENETTNTVTHYRRARKGWLRQRRTLDFLLVEHFGLLVAVLFLGLTTDCAREIFFLLAGLFAANFMFLIVTRSAPPPEDPTTPVKEDTGK